MFDIVVLIEIWLTNNVQSTFGRPYIISLSSRPSSLLFFPVTVTSKCISCSVLVENCCLGLLHARKWIAKMWKY
eukprot:m.51872 g.51872  ORF g.51872 m.51872 type:complete len:74 (+) comp7588_c2_seq1:26-247(+)